MQVVHHPGGQKLLHAGGGHVSLPRRGESEISLLATHRSVLGAYPFSFVSGRMDGCPEALALYYTFPFEGLACFEKHDQQLILDLG